MSIEKIKHAAEQIVKRISAAQGKGEEATKQAMVMPMLQAMGYDTWNPDEVHPEYEADFAQKKMGQKEKVDLAIFRNGLPSIFIEVKSVGTSLDKHDGQLARYFNSTLSVSLAIITNGLEWRLYTDAEHENRLDDKPFCICRLDTPDQGFDILSRFCKTEEFDSAKVRDCAKELKYTDLIASFLRSNFDPREEPEDYFVKWILTELKDKGGYSGMIFANVIAQFRPIVKEALNRIRREIVSRSMSAAMDAAAPASMHSQAQPPPPAASVADTSGEQTAEKSVPLSEDELSFYEAIKEIFNRSPFNGGMINEPGRRREIPIRLGRKGTTAYLGVFFNKPGWWFLRAMLNGNNKWIGLDLPSDIDISQIPEHIKILPATAHAPIRIAFSSIDELNILEPLILAAMERNVQQRACAQEGDDIQ